VYISCGNYRWGVVALPCVLESDGAFSLDHTVAVAEWIHVTKPNGWESIPYDPSRSADDVLLFQQTGPTEPLTKASIAPQRRRTQFI
jgi:hypothetical protein